MFSKKPPMMPEPSADAARHVFVYGTLRRGGSNDITRLHPAPVYVGRAHIEGVMHHLGAYPGLRLLPGQPVVGEVYAITAELERRLDEIEMILPEPTGEYTKRELLVPVDDGSGAARHITCLVYEINPAFCDGRPVIEGGDWTAHCGGPDAVAPARP